MSDSLFDSEPAPSEPPTRGKSGRTKAPKVTTATEWITEYSRRYTCGHETVVPHADLSKRCPICGEGDTLDTIRIRLPA